MIHESIETGDDTIAVYRPTDSRAFWTISLSDEHDWRASPDCLQVMLSGDAVRILALALNRGLMTPPPLPDSVPSMDGDVPRPIIVEGSE